MGHQGFLGLALSRGYLHELLSFELGGHAYGLLILGVLTVRLLLVSVYFTVPRRLKILLGPESIHYPNRSSTHNPEPQPVICNPGLNICRLAFVGFHKVWRTYPGPEGIFLSWAPNLETLHSTI